MKNNIEAIAQLASRPKFDRFKISWVLEVIAKFRFCRFSGFFEPIFGSFLGGYIRMLILPPKKEPKIGQKSSENRRTLSFATTSLVSSFLLAVFSSCSPLRTSPHDEKHQWELKLHEVQTNLDDLKHDINCFQTEIQILDGRIKYYEDALATLKQQDIEKQELKIEQINHDLNLLEKKWKAFERFQEGSKGEALQLASHANETTAALSQFKARMQELEQEIFSQNRRFEELAKLKGSIDALAKSFKTPFKIYKVRPGDSLEKIATVHHTTVQRIKKLNDLERDLIVVDQELKIPAD